MLPVAGLRGDDINVFEREKERDKKFSASFCLSGTCNDHQIHSVQAMLANSIKFR